MPGPEADLVLLLDAARQAGALALRHFRAGAQVWDKPGGQGPVTEADLAVNALLHDHLASARPGYGWLSEESDPLVDLDRLSARRVFVVDPIDGTRAFIDGQEGWAHALAVIEDGQPQAAVVHLPALGHTYAAALGQGATLNGQPISASSRTEVVGARLLVTRPALDPAHWPGGVPDVSRHFRPSLAWRLSLVAEGRFDAMLTLRDSWDWDIAAPSLIAREAGALVTDRHGEVLVFNRAGACNRGVLAAPPSLHATLLRGLTGPRP